MTFYDELSTRYKAKQKEWEKYKEHVREAKENETKAREELSALQVLMTSEKGKGKSKEQNVAVPLPIAPSQEANKAEVVRSLIQEHAVNGLAPAQIRKLLEARKFEMPTNYLYAILLRAKKVGRVIEKGGRYYPADEKEKTAS